MKDHLVFSCCKKGARNETFHVFKVNIKQDQKQPVISNTMPIIITLRQAIRPIRRPNKKLVIRLVTKMVTRPNIMPIIEPITEPVKMPTIREITMPAIRLIAIPVK